MTIHIEIDGTPCFVESAPLVPLVSMVVALRSGAVVDPVGKDGICRFMARLVRRGCEGMTSPEVETAIDRLGSELTLDVGPSTMSFQGQVIRRNLDAFVDLFTRVLGKPTFDNAEAERLRRESIAEVIDARDSDRALTHLAFRRGLFKSHVYARAAAGRPSTLETLTRDDAIAAYKRHVVRSDVVLGFAGAITEEEAKTIGARILAAIPEGPPVALSIAEPERPSGRRLFFVDKPDRTQMPTLIGGLGTHPKDADHFPLILATAAFGGTFTSRMMKEIRSKRGWSYGTSARLSIERRRHSFVMSAAPALNDCPPCITLQIELLEKLVADGITQRELAFIKNFLVRSHAFEIDTANKRLGQALEVELLQLPKDYHSGYVERVKGVTLEGSNGALKERLTPKDLVITVVGTASETLEKIKESIPDLAETTVIPYESD